MESMDDDDITPAKGITIGTEPVFREVRNKPDKKNNVNE